MLIRSCSSSPTIGVGTAVSILCRAPEHCFLDADSNGIIAVDSWRTPPLVDAADQPTNDHSDRSAQAHKMISALLTKRCGQGS
jgi:hypothetical protein